jgi:hypothetical protein
MPKKQIVSATLNGKPNAVLKKNDLTNLFPALKQAHGNDD